MTRRLAYRCSSASEPRRTLFTGDRRLARLWSFVCFSLLCAAGTAGEPDYESACANWNPVLYQCTVLSPKYSQSKFVAPFRGGVHTVYVSEALGHCPLIPGRARLMPHLPESIQVLFATGATPDFRVSPRSDLRQNLLDGGLPIVVTNWESPDEIFRFRETAFARQISDAMDPARGDENAAAFVRLRVVNASGKPQIAIVRLCINRSNNGQPRGVSAMEYGTGLRRDGDQLRTPDGLVRLIWNAPAGTTVETNLRKDVPNLLVWDPPEAEPVIARPQAEKAFNRYFATKSNEDHSGFKAIDRQMMTYWAPVQALGPKGLAIGLEFPEPRLVRQLAVRYEGDATPAIDGYRLEYQDGAGWTTIHDLLGGKTRAALLASDEEQKRLGSYWIHTFEPVRARRLRLVIAAMPKGKEKPAIAEIDYQYCSLSQEGPWIDTAVGDYLGNVVLFKLPIPANAARDVTACVPFLPCSDQEARWLAARDPMGEEAAVAAYWETQRAAGARIQVPEMAVQEAFDANIPHLFASTEIDPTNGLAITKTNVGWYEAIWPSLRRGGDSVARPHRPPSRCGALPGAVLEVARHDQTAWTIPFARGVSRRRRRLHLGALGERARLDSVGVGRALSSLERPRVARSHAAEHPGGVRLDRGASEAPPRRTGPMASA